MHQRLSLSLKNSVSEIERMARVVSEWCGQAQVSGEMNYEINLILDEIVSNVMRHGYKDDREHAILVNLSLNGDELAVEVQDDGIHYNPLSAPVPDLSRPIEERPIGGLGVHLVKQMVDSIDYRRENERNFLTMKKTMRRGEAL